MSQQSSSSTNNSTSKLARIVEEIDFQRVLLLSLEDTTGDHQSRKAEIEAEILKLGKEKQRLWGLQTSSSTNYRTPSTPHDNLKTRPSGIGPLKKNNKSPNMDHTFGRGSNGSYHSKEECDSMGSLSSTVSTPSSGASMAEFSGSTRVNLPTRKRSHSKHLDTFVPFEEIKSRKTTPSPYTTGVTTPSGSSGYGYTAIGDGYFDLTMDDDMAMFDPSYVEAQREQEERLKREREDAIYASRIAGQSGFVSSTPVINSKLSTSSKMVGARPQASASRHNQAVKSSDMTNAHVSHASSFTGRSLPWKNASNSIVKGEPQTPPVDQPSGFSSTTFGGTTGTHEVRPSASRYSEFMPMSTPTMPGAYIEDSATDSDLEIIDSSAFRDNGRQKSTASRSTNVYGQQNQFYSPNTLNFGETALGHTSTSLQNSLFGNSRAVPTLPTNSANGMGHNGQLNGYNSSAMPPWATGSTNAMNNIAQVGMQNSAVPAWARSGNLNRSSRMNTAPQGSFMNSTPSINSAFNSSNNSMALQSQSLSNPYAGSMHSAHPGTSMHSVGSNYTINSIPKYGKDQTIFNSLQGSMTGNMGTFPDLELDFDSFNSSSTFTPEMTYKMEHVINDPRKTEKEIKDLLDNIKSDVEIPLEDRVGTPEGMKYGLYEHQKIALTWMKQMEEGTNKGGILADDMGLGKTISTLALIVSRPSADPSCKTTLIAAPVALLRQWDSEILTKTVARHKPSVYMAHGNNKKATWDDLRVYDVVLTTYGTLSSEFNRLVKFEAECKQKEMEPDPKKMAKDFPFLGPKSRFYRVVLDEAQSIKNKATKSALAACRLRSVTRFCLTGTPMMNNITELYSLIHFLRIRPYNNWQSFSNAFGCLSKGAHTRSEEHIKKTTQHLQAVLKAILLRRTKQSKIDGKPIITLPPKFEHIDHVVFSQDENDFYKSLENKTQLQFNKYKKSGTVGKNYSNILVLLLRLRQCCCHPHLIIDLDAEAPPAGSAELSEEQMIKLAKNLAPDVVSRLLEANGFECNICYDATPNPSIIIPCGHDNCHDCLMMISEQAKQVARVNDEGSATVKCPSCRGSLDMANLIDYRSFKKAHIPSSELEEEKNVDDASDLSDDNTDSDSDIDGTSDEADENGDLHGFVVPDDVEDDEAEQGDDEDDDLEMEAPKSKTKSKPKKTRNKGKGKMVEKQKQHLSIAMMKKEASRSQQGHKKYMRYLRKNWQSSAKVDKCMELLKNFHAEDEKTIIFSQFVTFLDLLQVPIGEEKWKCERYDGSINSKRRNEAISRFTQDPDCKIMLISLKAGNAGLNLVAASRVIILDPFWNPFIEMQAVDRAYRIGQQKEVQVHRILVQETVEDRIMQLQEQKKKLVESALDEGAMKSVGRLDERQLGFLFGL